jgi:hypothetical protein
MEINNLCSICKQPGNVLLGFIDGQEYASSLCMEHDIACLSCAMIDDYTLLADMLVVPPGAPNDPFSKEMAARILVAFRMSALGLSPEDVEHFAKLVENAEEDADLFDVEWSVLNFLVERGIINAGK